MWSLPRRSCVCNNQFLLLTTINAAWRHRAYFMSQVVSLLRLVINTPQCNYLHHCLIGEIPNTYPNPQLFNWPINVLVPIILHSYGLYVNLILTWLKLYMRIWQYFVRQGRRGQESVTQCQQILLLSISGGSVQTSPIHSFICRADIVFVTWCCHNIAVIFGSFQFHCIRCIHGLVMLNIIARTQRLLVPPFVGAVSWRRW